MIWTEGSCVWAPRILQSPGFIVSELRESQQSEHHYVDDGLYPGFSCFESASMRLCEVLNPIKMRRDCRFRRLEY